MIVVYNLSGLLVGAAGVAVGFVVAGATGSISLGLLILAAVWCGAGLWWRSREAAPGVKNRFPAIFFIPLPILAAPVAMLGMLLIPLELKSTGKPADPRADLFRADERMLDSTPAPPDSVSREILRKVDEIPSSDAKAGPAAVIVRKSDEAVLVLVKTPKLKTWSDEVRRALLQNIAELVRGYQELSDKKLFIGIKGQLTFGAIRVPPDAVQTGGFVPQEMLYGFYGQPPAPAVAKSEGGVPQRRPRTSRSAP